MAGRSDLGTSPTLLSLVRLAPADEAAWETFTSRYGALIRAWCRHWGLQHADIEDVTQNVMLELAQQMRKFRYDASGSFRGWLKTIAYRAWCDFHSRRKGEVGAGGTEVLKMLHSVEARDSFMSRLEDEWNRELLAEAMKLVRQRVQEHTWEVFRLMTQEGISGPEVAERLGMKVGAVWVAKSKVQRMIQDEIRRLDTMSPLDGE